MNTNSQDTKFDKSAKKYDQKWKKIHATKDALHLITRIAFSDLPKKANILCVGVGTGDELIDLALHNSEYHFTAVDPSSEMIKICRQKAAQAGIISRCDFHISHLNTIDDIGKYHAATCFLVSHHITDVINRQAFFTDISQRLLPNGVLINADISGDITKSAYETQLKLWLNMYLCVGMSKDQIEKMRQSLGTRVAVLPTKEIEEIIINSGFKETTLIFQSLLMHAWYSQMPS